MEQQNLAMLIIRQILFLRFSPLQRRVTLENLSRAQVSALLQAIANCISNPANLFMCAGDDKHFAVWISCEFAIGRCHRLWALQVWDLTYRPELLKFLEPLFGRLPQCLNRISVFSLCLLDLAIANEPPESPLLTCVQVVEQPLYIAMSKREELASHPEVSLDQMNGRHWILFERQLHPPVYDAIIHAATQRGVRPQSIQHVTAPEEAFPFLADGSAVAFVVKAGALLVARNGVTVRPLNESSLKLKTCLAYRADDDSKIASEFVRAYMRKMPDKKHKQLPLPISA